jgi:DNA-binding response OmpR family regulator
MLRILHLEDDAADALLVRRAIQSSSLAADINVVSSRQAFLAALGEGHWDIVLADQSVPSFSGTDVIDAVRAQQPGTPLIVLSGAGEEARVVSSFRAGAADYILKDHLQQLVIALHRLTLDRSR